MTQFADNERLVDAMPTHWVKYVPQAILCHFLAIIGIALLIGSFLARTLSAFLAIGLALIGGTLFLFAHHKWFHKVMSEELIDIILTTERVIYFKDLLFFSDNEHEIPLHRVAGVEVKQEGFFQNILDYGTLWIDTGGGAIDLRRTIPNVPRPEQLSEKITRLVHDESQHTS